MRRLGFDVRDPEGLHAQSVARLVAAIGEFDCEVRIHSHGRGCDARSVFEVLALGIPQGARVTLVCEGPDEDACTEALTTLVETF